MTLPDFMNVVRYKLKPDCVSDYFQAVNKAKFEGIKQKYIAKPADFDYCFVGI